MSHLFKFQFVVAVAVLLSACASQPHYHHIDRAARPHLKAVDAYLVVDQEQIYAEHYKSRVSGAEGTGLLSQMIMTDVNQHMDKVSESFASQVAKPIQDNMQDYDFAQVLTDKLDAELGQIDWLHTNDLVLLRTREKDLFLTKWAESRASAILFIGADYWLSPDLSHATALVEAIMFPNAKALEAYKAEADHNDNPVNLADNIYRNKFWVRVPLKVEGLVKDRGDILARNGAQKVKAALTQCAVKVCESIGRDLERDETADVKKK